MVLMGIECKEFGGRTIINKGTGRTPKTLVKELVNYANSKFGSFNKFCELSGAKHVPTYTIVNKVLNGGKISPRSYSLIVRLHDYAKYYDRSDFVSISVSHILIVSRAILADYGSYGQFCLAFNVEPKILHRFLGNNTRTLNKSNNDKPQVRRLLHILIEQGYLTVKK